MIQTGQLTTFDPFDPNISARPIITFIERPYAPELKPYPVYKYVNNFIYKTHWYRKKRKLYVYVILMNGVKLWKSYKSPYKLNKYSTQCLITVLYADLYRATNMFYEYRYSSILQIVYGVRFIDHEFEDFQKVLLTTENVHIEFMSYAPTVNIEEIIDYE